MDLIRLFKPTLWKIIFFIVFLLIFPFFGPTFRECPSVDGAVCTSPAFYTFPFAVVDYLSDNGIIHYHYYLIIHRFKKE